MRLVHILLGVVMYFVAFRVSVAVLLRSISISVGNVYSVQSHFTMVADDLVLVLLAFAIRRLLVWRFGDESWYRSRIDIVIAALLICVSSTMLYYIRGTGFNLVSS